MSRLQFLVSYSVLHEDSLIKATSNVHVPAFDMRAVNQRVYANLYWKLNSKQLILYRSRTCKKQS